MNVSINYKTLTPKKSAINQVLFVDENFNILKKKNFFQIKNFYLQQIYLKLKILKKKLLV